MGGYTFIYFNVRGRGQATRYLLVDNGIQFEEVDCCPDEQTWLNDFKPKMPFGQTPLLKDGDFEVAQSNAILRYLGRKHGLHPTDPQAAAKLDMISDHIEDIRCAYVKLIYETYDTEKEKYTEELPSKLQPFENLLKKWGNEYITAQVSFADYNLLDLLEIHLILSPTCLDKLPTLQQFVRTMQNRDKIKKYQETEYFKNLDVNGNDNK